MNSWRRSVLQSDTVSMSHSLKNRLHYFNVPFRSPIIWGWWYRNPYSPSSLSSHMTGLYTEEGIEKEQSRILIKPSLPCCGLLDHLSCSINSASSMWNEEVSLAFSQGNYKIQMREQLGSLYREPGTIQMEVLGTQTWMELVYLFRVLGTFCNLRQAPNPIYSD